MKTFSASNNADISGIILCGGSSRRMGADKALLEISGSRIIDTICALAATFFRQVYLIGDDSEKYCIAGTQTFPDIHKGFGPLGGIFTGLTHCGMERSLVLSCDLPLINEQTIRRLLECESAKQIIIPRAGNRLHPLCAIYSKTVLPVIESFSQQSLLSKAPKVPSVHKLLDECTCEVIEWETPGSDEIDPFFNMNTPEDYQYILSLFDARKNPPK